MTAVWVDEDGALVGSEVGQPLDPGTGDARYQSALGTLRSSGRELAFCSFTFDVGEAGSMVLIPRSVERRPGIAQRNLGGAGEMIDDGVAAWRTGFEKAMLEIEAGRVEKVVLARRVTLRMGDGSDDASLLSVLSGANPDCYLFSVGGLVGASPELLVSLRNGRASTLALAGTATSPGDLGTVKISEEHRHVASSVRDALGRHVEGLDVDEQVIVTHGAMSHAGTKLEGPVRPGTTVADILADLHPTAAVAGSPARTAMELIREIEPASRGRYAGPIGWMDSSGDGVFAIALRCGQVEGEKITLWAGGGLVAGSEEEAELEETELKLAPMLHALGQPNS